MWLILTISSLVIWMIGLTYAQLRHILIFHISNVICYFRKLGSFMKLEFFDDILLLFVWQPTEGS